MPEKQVLMPVSDDHALRQFEIEALRQITDNLKGIRDEAKEDRKLLHEIHTRVVRIETKETGERMDDLEGRVAVLEADKNRRDGAISAWDWLLKSWPNIVGFFALIVAILALTGKLKGLAG